MLELHGRRHEGFAQARTALNVNLFEVVAGAVAAAQQQKRRVVIAGFTEGSVERLGRTS